MKLSDKILIIFFIFATLLIFAVWIFIGGSILQILLLCNVVYIVAFFVTFFISRNFSKKLLNLAFKVEEMAAGNFSMKIESKKKDEIGQLTNALNELISRLQSGIAQDIYKYKAIAQAKTDFVNLAAHQLRTPLSIVKWYSDYLVTGEGGKLNEEQEKYINEIYKSNERIIDLVNALLDVSRIDLGTFTIEINPTDIVERADSAVKKFEPIIRTKKIKLIKKFDDIPVMNLDPRLIKVVFENILSNAVKYTPINGAIKFEIKKADRNVLIKIADSGCGIPRELHPNVFTKFFRGDNVRKIESTGTGLGLYIVKAIIEKSGGKIWFESPSIESVLEEEEKRSNQELDKKSLGTIFFISIPIKGMKPKKGTKKITGKV